MFVIINIIKNIIIKIKQPNSVRII